MKWTGWIIFSEPNASCPIALEWKKPSREFCKCWKTKAIPVTITPTKRKKSAK